MATCPPRARNRALGAALIGSLAFAGLLRDARADEVELTGGSRLTGIVLERSEAGVRLLLPGGDEIRLSTADVARVRPDPEAPAKDAFLRFTKEGARPGLQAAVLHYVKAGAPRVDLVGAVHAADAAYFRETQRWLDRVDVVLYEMVKPKDAAPWAHREESGGPESAVTGFQRSLARMFDLTFQLEHIDYRRAHFVHADMTEEEFLAAGGAGMTKEAEAMLARVKPLLAIAEAAMRPSADASAERRASAERMRANVKEMLARMLGSVGPNAGRLLGGGEGGDLLIGKRDEVAMRRLDELPPGLSSVAIFYGAAHLSDLEKRLVERGYVRAGGRWVTAWDVSPTAEASPTAPATPEPKREPAPATPPSPTK